MDENAEGVARSLRGLEKFRVHVMVSGAFEVTAEDEDGAEKGDQAKEGLRRNLTEKMFSLSTHINGLRTILPGIMPARIEFTDEQLEEMTMMYQYGFSSYEIADWFGVSYMTVLRRLRERGQTIRPAAHLRDGFKFKEGNIPPSYVEREIPEPWTDIDAAYVFGVLIGDASIQYDYYEGKRTTPSSFMVCTPDKQFVGELSKAFKSAFDIQVKDYTDNENSFVIANSVDLGRSYDRFRWRKEFWRIPKPFFSAPEEIRIALCQGKFDSDGTIDGKAAVIRSIHREGLVDLRKIVKGLTLETTFNGPYTDERRNGKDSYLLRVLSAPPKLFRLPRKKGKLK